MSQDFAAPSGTAAEAPLAPQPSYSMTSRLAAEAFGTFILILGIVGTAALNAVNGGSILPVALAGGIMLMAGVAAVGHVSGGHFNPAVTLGLALAGRTPWRDLLPYWVAQLVGAALGALVVFAVIPSGYAQLIGADGKAGVLRTAANGYGEHSPLFTLTNQQAEFTQIAALLVEVILTAVLVGVILSSGRERTSRAPYPPVLVGLVLGALIIIAWPVTNASLNPARSFAAALFAGGWTWGQFFSLFLWAPLLGGAVAALFYRAFSTSPAAADEAHATAPAGDTATADETADGASVEIATERDAPAATAADPDAASDTRIEAAVTDAEVEAAEAEAHAEERRDGEDGGVTPR